MKKLFSFLLPALYKMLCHFSIAFSGIMLTFWSFMRESSYINYERIEIFAVFALIFGISSIIFAIPKLPVALKALLHFVVGITAFLSTFVSDGEASTNQMFILAVVFTAVYAVIFGLSVLLKALSRSKNEASEEAEIEENV